MAKASGQSLPISVPKSNLGFTAQVSGLALSRIAELIHDLVLKIE